MIFTGKLEKINPACKEAELIFRVGLGPEKILLNTWVARNNTKGETWGG